MTSSPGLRGWIHLQACRGVLQTTTDARAQQYWPTTLCNNELVSYCFRRGSPCPIRVGDSVHCYCPVCRGLLPRCHRTSYHTAFSQLKCFRCRLRMPGLCSAHGTLVGLWFNTAASYPLACQHTLRLHLCLMKCCCPSPTTKMHQFVSSWPKPGTVCIYRGPLQLLCVHLGLYLGEQ